MTTVDTIASSPFPSAGAAPADAATQVHKFPSRRLQQLESRVSGFPLATGLSYGLTLNRGSRGA